MSASSSMAGVHGARRAVFDIVFARFRAILWSSSEVTFDSSSPTRPSSESRCAEAFRSASTTMAPRRAAIASSRSPGDVLVSQSRLGLAWPIRAMSSLVLAPVAAQACCPCGGGHGNGGAPSPLSPGPRTTPAAGSLAAEVLRWPLGTVSLSGQAPCARRGGGRALRQSGEAPTKRWHRRDGPVCSPPRLERPRRGSGAARRERSGLG